MALLTVKIDDGIIEGIPAGNQMVSLFRGIPYAAPPIGELRWKDPQPVQPWNGVLKAYKFTNICWQDRVASEGGTSAAAEFYCIDHPRSEDCLYLNVWTPAKSADEKLPVAVYFHGGGYSTGYGFLNCYDGEGFAKRGCIYVTVTHRLNVFGFLAHPWLTAESENKTSGNYGAMDLIAALKWVNKNIAAFGGDPDCVTIFGQSGGGGKTQTMIASPLAKGLFKRAIMQSGGGLTGTYRFTCIGLDEGEKIGEKFFDYMGFKTLEEARAMPAEELFTKFSEYNKTARINNPRDMAPKYDNYLLRADRSDIFRAAEHDDLDYMVGSTAQEFYNFNPKLPTAEALRAEAERDYGEFAEQYIKAVNLDDPDYAMQFFYDPMGDGFTAATIAWCENQLDIGYKPSYQYYFTQVPPGAETAHHSAEHHYVFQTLMRSNRPYGPKDFQLSNQLCDYWTNFVKTGNPNGEGLPEWTPYTRENPKALNIKYDLEMEKVPENAVRTFIKDFSLKRLKK